MSEVSKNYNRGRRAGILPRVGLVLGLGAGALGLSSCDTHHEFVLQGSYIPVDCADSPDLSEAVFKIDVTENPAEDAEAKALYGSMEQEMCAAANGAAQRLVNDFKHNNPDDSYSTDTSNGDFEINFSNAIGPDPFLIGQVDFPLLKNGQPDLSHLKSVMAYNYMVDSKGNLVDNKANTVSISYDPSLGWDMSTAMEFEENGFPYIDTLGENNLSLGQFENIKKQVETDLPFFNQMS